MTAARGHVGYILFLPKQLLGYTAASAAAVLLLLLLRLLLLLYNGNDQIITASR